MFEVARARAADLGLNPLALRLIAIQAAVLAIQAFTFAVLGLSIEWSGHATVAVVMLGLLLALWLHFYAMPGSANDRFVAEVIFVVLLMVLFTNIGSPAQYAAVALKAPYADWWLAAADARLGFHVPSIAAWTRAHPAISSIMTLSYYSLIAQILATLLGLAVLRQRMRLWEFVFHFHVCLTIVLAALVVWPAVCPAAYYGFLPTIDQTRLIAQIQGFHDGTMTTVRFDDLEGLVSFPSFHATCGVIVTWAFRGYLRVQVPLILLNSAMLLATFATGAHYVVDVIAAFPLFAISVAAYRWWGRALLVRSAT